MDTLLLAKLISTPLLVSAATLAGRRWGSAAGGMLIGLPLTTGPISFFLSRQHGAPFAIDAAAGGLAGQVAVFSFCVVYVSASKRASWQVSLLSALGAFLAAAGLIGAGRWELVSALLFLAVGLFLAFRMIPEERAKGAAPPAPRWDLPLRILAATTFVVAITASASFLGPQWSGILGTLPIYSAVFATFTHRAQGREAAAQVLKGVLVGSTGYAAFFTTVGLLLNRLGPETAYFLAILAALATSGSVFRLRRRRAGSR